MPYGGNLHIAKALTNLTIQYKNSEYIAPMFLKDIPVQKESDLYYVYERNFRIEDTWRANKSPSNQVTWGISTSSYSCDEHALSDIVSDRDRRNSDAINVDVDTTEFLTDKILLTQEWEAATLMFTTTSWGGNAQLATATSWNYNTTTSAPIQNVLSGTGYIVQNSGVRPNTLVIGWDTFQCLKENPNVYDRIKYVERAIVTEQLLAAIFDVDNVYVGKAVYDTSKESAPGNTAIASSMTFMWGGHALLGYFNPNPGLRKVTAAGTMRVTEAGMPYKVKKWRKEELAGDIIEVSTMFTHKLIATSCAYYFSSVTGRMS